MAAGFREGFVAADAFRLRHVEAGVGRRSFMCTAQILSSEGLLIQKT